MQRHILIVEDDPAMRLGMSHFLTSQGYTVSLFADGDEGAGAIEGGRFDMIITDMKLPHRNGLEVLKRAKTVSPQTGVIIITGYAEIKGAVQAMKEGAFDYIAKPFSNDELLITIDRFFEFQRLKDEVAPLKEILERKTEFENIIGDGSAIKDVFDCILLVAETDMPVFIHGESGTGKELVANAIYSLSKRSGKPFVKINCAAIPESLFEAELFGHEKGAFTSAGKTRQGKFEFSDGGTIFFDEISDMPISLQPKLLRVLEDKSIMRLGGNITVSADVRTIYATNENMKELVASGRFRKDLFYRINMFPIYLPPLRERSEDIPCLIGHFLKQSKEKLNRADLSISPPAYDMLLSYDYPGNIRELKHAIERAAVLSKDGVIDIRHLPDDMLCISDMAPCITKAPSLADSSRCFEKQKIIKALSESGGRKIETAQRLGISRKVLWKKLKEYNSE